MQFTSIHAVEICFHRNKMVCEKNIFSSLVLNMAKAKMWDAKCKSINK